MFEKSIEAEQMARLREVTRCRLATGARPVELVLLAGSD
jgi:hypothetical protein